MSRRRHVWSRGSRNIGKNDESLEFYNAFYGHGGWYYNLDEQRSLLKSIAYAAGWGSKSKILEVGCGLGMQARVFSEMGIDVTAVDVSSVAIEVAQKQNGEKENLRYFACDLAEFTMAACVFDGIYARGMSYFHYELDGVNCKGIDVPAQTERLFSWLRPGGTFVLQICTDLSGERPGERVHSNRYLDYLDLFERFGRVVSFTTLEGHAINETTKGDLSRSRTQQGIILVVKKDHRGN